MITDSPIVLFGYSEIARRIIERLPCNAFVCDNDPAKQDDENGFNSPERAWDIVRGLDHIFITCMYQPAAARRQLLDLGVPPERIRHWIELFREHPAELLPWACIEEIPAVLPFSIPDLCKLWSDDRSYMEWKAVLEFLLSDVYVPIEDHDDLALIYFAPTVYRALPDEHFVDVGAFDGDTLKAFRNHNKSDKATAIAIEADPQNFASLSLKWARVPAVRLVYTAAVSPYCTDATVGFGGEGPSARLSGDDWDKNRVPANTLDTILANESPTLIKIDIEGADLDALRGCVETIKRCRPVIAVVTYHHLRDLWEIPAFMAYVTKGLDYKLAFRRYAADCWETCVFAVPAERWCAE